MDAKIKQQLWELINPAELLNPQDLLKGIEELLVAEDSELDRLPLSQLYHNWDNSSRVNLQKAVLKNRQGILHAQQAISLAINLFKNKAISLIETAEVLSSISEVERKALTAQMREVVETAEIVTHDSKEGFLGIDDDDIFVQAIEKALDKGE